MGGGGGWEGEKGRKRGGGEGVGDTLVSGNQYLLNDLRRGGEGVAGFEEDVGKAWRGAVPLGDRGL